MAESFTPSELDYLDSGPKGPYSHDFLSEFKIADYMKSALFGLRPVKLKTKVLFEQIDRLLDQRFEFELTLAKKSLNIKRKSKKPPESFSLFVFKKFLDKFNTRVLAEKKLLTFLFSLDCLREDYEYVDLFCGLLNDEFRSAEINCFLLLRYASD